MNNVRFNPAGCASGFAFGCDAGTTIWIGCFHKKHWVPTVETDPDGNHFYHAKYRYLSSDKKAQLLITHESVHMAIENVESLQASSAYEDIETRVWNDLGTMV